jgi:two-component system, NtrC family, sensor histidine kinase HydH
MQLQRARALRSVHIIAIAVLLAAVMVVSAVIELAQSRNELYHLMREEAVSLVETVDQSSSNIILSTEKIEEALAERLFNNAYFIARLDSAGILTQKELQSIAAANSIFRINIIDRNGVKILGNTLPDMEHRGMQERRSPRETLQPILEGSADKLLIGLREPRFQEGKRFIVAVRRTGRARGAIVLNLNADAMLELRKTIGIGKLMKDLGDNEGIVYAVLQDSDGILAAGGKVTEVSSIGSDSLLHYCTVHDTVLTRTLTGRSGEIFEVVRHFKVGEASLGIFRIGLSMDEIHAAEARMLRRMIVMTLVLLAIAFLAVASIVVMQNYTTLGKKYTVMQTMTGNILDRMSDAVVSMDGGRTITLFNKEAGRLFGVDDQSVIGKRIDELTSPVAHCIEKIFGSSDETEIELHCGRDTRSVSVAVSESDGGEGGVIRTAVVRDMTKTHALEKEMLRREKMTAMGELASGVAHEIRNPLNAIAMIAQRFLIEFTPRKAVKEYRMLAGVLQSEARRMNGIVQQFLHFARPPGLRVDTVAMQPFLAHLSSLFGPQAGEKGIAFTETSACPEEWAFDQEQMTQALLNLLQNALDATERGGKIELAVAEKGTDLTFSIIDTGAGIPEDEREKIFNLYFTTKQHGTGLGLPFVHQIVAQHNGTLEMTSEVGKGTTFIITVPSVQERPRV